MTFCARGSASSRWRKPSTVRMAFEAIRQDCARPPEHRQNMGHASSCGGYQGHDPFRRDVRRADRASWQPKLAQRLSRPPARPCPARSCISVVRTAGKMPGADRPSRNVTSDQAQPAREGSCRLQAEPRGIAARDSGGQRRPASGSILRPVLSTTPGPSPVDG